MADRWAVATGNWSSTATWNGGTLPTSADDVFADGFTVTIDQNVTVLSIRTTQRTGGTAGGGFILNAGIIVNANIIAGNSTVLTRSTGSGASFINGNITGVTSGTGISAVILSASAGSLVIVGNVIGGGGSNSNDGVAVLNSVTTGSLTITGNVTGGSSSVCRGVWTGNSSAIITINGNVSPGSGHSCHGVINSNPLFIVGTVSGGSTANAGVAVENLLNGSVSITGTVIGGNVSGAIGSSSTGSITINGNVIAGVVSAISNTSSGTVTINGTITGNGSPAISSTGSGFIIANSNLISSSTGVTAVSANRLLVSNSNNLQHAYRVNNSGAVGAERSLYTGGVNLNQPTVTNVRSGTVYGASNEFTGTLIVPSAQFVSLGTPVDSGVGSLQYLTMADLQAALAPNSPVIAERSDDDTKALTFSWPASGASILGFKSFDNGAYSSVSGAISYLRTEGARHYYTLAYNAADRSSQESLIRYRMQDGTYTKYFNLRIMPASNSEIISIKAKTDNLPADPASSSQITSLLNNAPMEAF